MRVLQQWLFGVCVSVCLDFLVQTITPALKHYHNLSQIFFICNMYTLVFHWWSDSVGGSWPSVAVKEWNILEILYIPMTMFIHRIRRTVQIKGQGINSNTDWHVDQIITSMSVGSTCRLHASRTLNKLPCISSHNTYGIGEPGKLRIKAGSIIRYQS